MTQTYNEPTYKRLCTARDISCYRIIPNGAEDSVQYSKTSRNEDLRQNSGSESVMSMAVRENQHSDGKLDWKESRSGIKYVPVRNSLSGLRRKR